MKRRDFLTLFVLTAGMFTGCGYFDNKLIFPQKNKEYITKSGSKKMKIFVLTGSPRKNGNSNTLAEYFIKGAEEKGHKVLRFDSAFKKVHPCLGCNKCGMDGDCIFQDDFNFVRDNIVDSDVVVFATPMYYFGISSQLKTVIDRFYSINGKIHIPKKAILLMTYANNSKYDESPIKTHYEVLLNYLGWKDIGQIIANSVWPVGAINHTKYLEEAYKLGKSL